MFIFFKNSNFIYLYFINKKMEIKISEETRNFKRNNDFFQEFLINIIIQLKNLKNNHFFYKIIKISNYKKQWIKIQNP